jgi:hypothetical protein
MPLRIKCSSGHTLIVPDDRAGRRLRCPRCQAEVVVPGEAAEVAAAASVAVAAEEPFRSLPASAAAVSPEIDSASPPKPSPAVSEKRREPGRSASRSVVKPKSRALPTPPPEQSPAARDSVPPPAKVAPPRSQPIEPATPAEPSPPPPPVVRPAPAVLLKVPDVAPPPVAAPPKSRETAVRPEKIALPPTTAEAPPLPTTLPATVPLPPQTATPSLLAQPPVEFDEQLPAVVQLASNNPTPDTPPHNLAPDQPALDETAPTRPAAAPTALAEPAEEEGLFDHLAALDFAPPAAAIRPVAAEANPEGARTLAVYQLAAALVAAALFSVAPAVWDLVEYLRIDGSPFVARWALLLFFIGVLQLAYAVYLFQLPDWSSVWVITVFALCGAALYAAVLGIVLMSAPDGVLVGPHGLQLADKLAGGKAALWCVAMVALLVMLALAAGKLCLSWQRAERMLIAARGAG